MSKRRKRTFSPEFKIEAVKLATTELGYLFDVSVRVYYAQFETRKKLQNTPHFRCLRLIN